MNRWLPSRLQPSDPEATRHASWLELFFDLVFVAIVAQLTHYLIHHNTLLDWGIALLLFVPMHEVWSVHTGYSTRYEMNRPAGRAITTLFMICAVFYAVGIQQGLDGNMLLVIVPFLICRLTWWHMYNWANGWQRRRLRARDVPVELAGYLEVGIWILSIWLPQPYQQFAWIAALLLAKSLAYVLMASTPVLVKDPHREHGPERMGLFVIIAMGESVVAVVSGLGDAHWDTGTIAIAMGGVAMLVTLWWLYFDMLEIHVSGSGRLGSGLLFGDIGIVILMGLMTFAAGIGAALAHHVVEGMALIVAGLGLFILCTHAIAHMAQPRGRQERVLLVAMLGILAATWQWAPLDQLVLVATVLALSLGSYTALVRRLDPPIRGAMARV